MNNKYCSLFAISLVVVVTTLLTKVSQLCADLPPLIKREILFGNPERLVGSPIGTYTTWAFPTLHHTND